MTFRQRVMAAARQVREWAEMVAEEEEFPDDLCGLCARASAKLHQVLEDRGIKADIVLGWGHVFLVVKDMVLDVTATQFGWPEILYRKWERMKKDDPEVYKEGILGTYKTVHGLRRRQRTDGWTREEVARLKRGVM